MKPDGILIPAIAVAAILLLAVPAVGVVVGMALASDRDGSSDQGHIYTYEDGDRTIRVILQTDLALEKNSAINPNDVVVVKGSNRSIVRKQPGGGTDSLPVFRSESGGGLMTLPGGVLLALDPEWDEVKIEDFFSRNNIAADRISELGFLKNGFFVETASGFPSLELANSLAAKNGVVISSPNWWSEVAAK